MLDRPTAQMQSDGMAQAAAPLFMLPGTLCDARIYRPVLDLLGLEAEIPHLGGASSAAEMARLLLADAPDRLSLVGFSLGAIVAFEIVAQAPHRVERLCVIGANPGLRSETEFAARARLAKDDFLNDDDPPLTWAMARDATEQTWRDQTAITINRSDSRPRLPAIGVPTLVICGAEDPISPPAMSRDITDRVPRAVMALVPDAGHYVTIEQPEAVAAHIAAWLATPIS